MAEKLDHYLPSNKNLTLLGQEIAAVLIADNSIAQYVRIGKGKHYRQFKVRRDLIIIIPTVIQSRKQ